MSLRLAAVFVVLLAPSCAAAADIRIVPADFIVLNPTNPDKGYSDLLVHTIAIATGANENATLDTLRVEVLSKGRRVLTREVSPEEMQQDTQFLAGAPLKEFVAGQLLNARGLDGLFGRQIAFAPSAAMAPSQALLVTRLYFAVGFVPDEVRVVATLSGAGGEQTVQARVAVRSYASPIAYRVPLTGQWLMNAIPGVQSHHRFNPATEFAVDFFKLGPDGHMAHGDKLDARNFYGFGAPVMAAADGTVVAVISDQVQDRAAVVRRSGEPLDGFYKRVEEFHMAGMTQNFRAANAGNLVTIRHEKGGVVEYSSYGHLRTGSVRVKVGDHVAQGQIIAEVGDTGDSAAVHLHFQVNTGPDAFTSKSLPAVFSNLASVEGNDELGRLVTTAGGEEIAF
jgi:Peptidase family M23